MPTTFSLSLQERAQVEDALKDALCELESDDLAEYVSQKLITKLEKAILVFQE